MKEIACHSSDADDKNEKTPETGDHQNVALYDGMTLAAMHMAGIIFAFRKKGI